MEQISRGCAMACWAALCLYWLIAARGAKKTERSGPRWGGPWMRLALVVVIAWVVFWSLATQRSSPVRQFLLLRPPRLAVPGALLVVAGAALAIWARAYIGRNWGMPMSLRQGHELVTTGPYAYLRHPIYSGILLMMVGSALVLGMGWLVAFLVYGTYFLWSARAEERHMTLRFPQAYPAYRQRTWMLIPFLL